MTGCGWGVTDAYPGRVHLVADTEAFALCSTRLLHCPLPIVRRWPHRPAELTICPECALAFLLTACPAVPTPDAVEPLAC